jgi:hypothetical protein
MTKKFGGDRTNDLTTTFGAVGGIFIKNFSSMASDSGWSQWTVVRHLEIATF